jgi:peptidyl-tRNA hydrolase
MEVYKAKMVIVMRNDLNMRKGKMISQASHTNLFVRTVHAKTL